MLVRSQAGVACSSSTARTTAAARSCDDSAWPRLEPSSARITPAAPTYRAFTGFSRASHSCVGQSAVGSNAASASATIAAIASRTWASSHGSSVSGSKYSGSYSIALRREHVPGFLERIDGAREVGGANEDVVRLERRDEEDRHLGLRERLGTSEGDDTGEREVERPHPSRAASSRGRRSLPPARRSRGRRPTPRARCASRSGNGPLSTHSGRLPRVIGRSMGTLARVSRPLETLKTSETDSGGTW